MARQPPPNWQPISRLPPIASVLDGMLGDAQEHYRTLREVQARPHVLDDHTVERVVSVFTAQRDDLWLFEEQLRRWGEQGLDAEQRREVSRLTHQLESLRQVITEILTLAEALKHGTIERVLSRDDAELALEWLLRRPPEREH